MKRKNFDKIVTAVGFGLTVFLFITAGLLNWGATFASDSVKSQLDNQNISFPAAEAMPEATKDKLAKWAEVKVTTGEMARDYSDLYIWEHMKGSAIAAIGKPATYSEVSGMYMGLVRGGSTDTAQIAKLGELRETFASLEAGSETETIAAVAGRIMLKRDQGKLIFITPVFTVVVSFVQPVGEYTTNRYSPESDCVFALTFNESAVAPLIGLPFFNHWKLNAPV